MNFSRVPDHRTRQPFEGRSEVLTVISLARHFFLTPCNLMCRIPNAA